MKRYLLFFTAFVCLAQNEEKKPPEQPKYFRVEFEVREMEGSRPVSSRNYGMTVSAFGKGSIRTGDRVPVPANVKDGSVTFLDVGVSIDWSMQGVTQNQIVPMHIAADISGVASEKSDKPGALPLINATKSSSDVNVPLRKATNVFSADSTTTKRKMQMDVTLTPLP